MKLLCTSLLFLGLVSMLSYVASGLVASNEGIVMAMYSFSLSDLDS
jgi:hypothetical protein